LSGLGLPDLLNPIPTQANGCDQDSPDYYRGEPWLSPSRRHGLDKIGQYGCDGLARMHASDYIGRPPSATALERLRKPPSRYFASAGWISQQVWLK
jgi:hypothetical protein